MTLAPSTSPAPLVSRAAFARIAGALYALVIVLGIVSVGRIEAFLAADGDVAATVAAVTSNAASIRWAFLGELAMYGMVIALAVSLYVVLRPVDRNLALLAAAWRVAEALVGATLAILATALPLYLAGAGSDAAGAVSIREALVPLLIGANPIGRDVVLLFMGFGGTLFFVLFWRSRLVPRLLAGLGILTYVAMIAITLASILVPGVSEGTKLLVYAPGGVFELVFGLWLLARGVREVGGAAAVRGSAPRPSGA